MLVENIVDRSSTLMMDKSPLKKKSQIERFQSSIDQILFTMFEEQLDHTFNTWSLGYTRYRGAVCEWVIDVCRYFKLDLSTTHKAIVYLDRIQPDESYERVEWQMVAITCVLVAAKFNEKEEHLPPLSMFEDITHQKISTAQLLEYELWLLRSLGWELNAYPPLAFVNSFNTRSVIFRGDIIRGINNNNSDSMSELEKKRIQYTNDLATKCILCPDLKRIVASHQAAAIVYMSRRHLDIQPWWRQELETMTRCDLTTVTSVVQLIDSLGVSVPVATSEKELDTVDVEANELGSSSTLEDSGMLCTITTTTSEEMVSFENINGSPLPKASPSSVVEMGKNLDHEMNNEIVNGKVEVVGNNQMECS